MAASVLTNDSEQPCMIQFCSHRFGTLLCSRDIHGKACVVTAAQSQGSRVPASTSAASASTSGRTTPVVRPPVNPGRGMASRQPMVSDA